MARVDRSIWILVLTGAIAALIIYALTSNAHAALTAAVACLLGVALLFEGLERKATIPLNHGSEARAIAKGLEQIDALLQALPHPSLIIGNGRIERCNRAALELLGTHIVGQDVRLALRHPAAIDRLTGPHAAEEPSRVEIVGLGSATQSWELDIQPIGQGRVLALLFDQSGRQATERMRVDFVANASHELRTPLAGILGFVETLRDPMAGGEAETRERFLKIIDGEARRMQRLVEDLMSLSRIEADRYRLPDEAVVMASLIEEVAHVCRQSQNAQGREIALNMVAPVPLARGDRAQLNQLLHNLISNALKYGAPGTAVTIDLRSSADGMVEIAIGDEGDGVAPEHLPRLTERFYRVDSGRSRAMGGTGLGLAIVKHIIERHGGVLHFESKVGVGTTVRVKIPAFQGASARTSSPVLPVRSNNSITESQK